jgi:hypothetical protein
VSVPVYCSTDPNRLNLKNPLDEEAEALVKAVSNRDFRFHEISCPIAAGRA